MTNPSDKTRWRMPAEWERHAATWITWPHNADDWPGKFDPIPWVYVEIVRHLHQSEPVHIVVNSEAAADNVRELLQRANIDLERVRFFPIPTNRVWIRDYGPTFVQSPDGSIGAVDWRFNAWAKYDDYHLDNAVSDHLRRELQIDWLTPMWNGRPIILEGGSIDVNGQGLLLTTEDCLLSTVQQRNPELSRADYEAIFRQYLGVEKTLWLNRGIAGDDTHGHVDDLARFVGPRTIVVVHEENPDDENYEPLKENIERLQSMTDLHGRPLEVVLLPMPEPVLFDRQRLPASYANFYIANDRVLMPTFNDPHDRTALAILGKLFPTRTVVGIHAVDLVWGLGTLHCLTQQQVESGDE